MRSRRGLGSIAHKSITAVLGDLGGSVQPPVSLYLCSYLFQSCLFQSWKLLMATERTAPAEPSDVETINGASPATAQPLSPTADPQPGSTALTATRVGFAIVVAALLGWSINAFMPAWYTIPEELLGVDMYSPRAMQDALAESEKEVYWKNSLIYFTVLGVSWGLAPLLMVLGSGVRNPVGPAIGGIVAGLVFGALAFVVGAGLRSWLNTGVELPLIGHADESLAGDIFVFALAGAVVTLPVMIGVLMMRVVGGSQVAVSVPLAAVVAGLLYPVTASFLLPHQNTKDFPPMTPAMSGLWLALLAVLITLLMVTTGDRKRAVPATGHATA